MRALLVCVAVSALACGDDDARSGRPDPAAAAAPAPPIVSPGADWVDGELTPAEVRAQDTEWGSFRMAADLLVAGNLRSGQHYILEVESTVAEGAVLDVQPDGTDLESVLRLDWDPISLQEGGARHREDDVYREPIVPRRTGDHVVVVYVHIREPDQALGPYRVRLVQTTADDQRF